jgi:hypothetical protein
MIKGISIDSSFSDLDNIPLPNFDHLFIQAQDTIKSGTPVQSQETQSPSVKSDSNTLLRQPKNTVTNQQPAKVIVQPQQTTPQDTVYVFKGSTTRIFDYYPTLTTSLQTNENINSNVIANIGEKSLFGAPVAPIPHIDTTKAKANLTTTVPAPKKPEVITGFEGKEFKSISYDWYTMILLIALAIFAWGKSLYHKYLLQIISSVYNYQISIQLFRDKNALFRNLSIILQVLYPISFGLLIYSLLNYFHLKQVFDYALASISAYSAGVFLFFQFKTMLYKFLGMVFKVEEDFHEIQHHLNIFNQTIGIFLLPFLISIPFLDDRFKPIAIVGLFLFAGATLLLFFYRGFQVVTRKQVSLFFLILYLCAVEILPIVLVIKTSYSII